MRLSGLYLSALLRPTACWSVRHLPGCCMWSIRVEMQSGFWTRSERLNTTHCGFSLPTATLIISPRRGRSPRQRGLIVSICIRETRSCMPAPAMNFSLIFRMRRICRRPVGRLQKIRRFPCWPVLATHPEGVRITSGRWGFFYPATVCFICRLGAPIFPGEISTI